MRVLLPASVFAVALTACADPGYYLDRRDTISFHAGDAIAANIAVHTVDPWPRVAGNRDIHFDGERMQAAAERYRTGKVIQPQGLGTSDIQITGSPASGGGSASQ